jgi:hypothetical protein
MVKAGKVFEIVIRVLRVEVHFNAVIEIVQIPAFVRVVKRCAVIPQSPEGDTSHVVFLNHISTPFFIK